MDIQLYYEDPYIAVVEKPAGLLTHPNNKQGEGSLVELLGAYYAASGQACLPHLLSRLDRYTSGLMLAAKAPRLQYLLGRPAAGLRKEYLAIVEGRVDSLPEEGRVDAPIARKEGSLMERQVDFSRGQAALTYYRVLLRRPGRALLRLCLATGRTHQIRVHMAYLGCPLVGDGLYGPPGPPGRHALHSAYLSFRHPISQHRLEISSALPADLAAWL